MADKKDIQIETKEYYFGKQYDGSDINVTSVFNVKDKDGKDSTIKFDFASIVALHVVVQTEMVPRYEMGNPDPIGLTIGKRSIGGSASFATVAISVVEEIKAHLGTIGIDIKYIDQIPNVDFVITADNGKTKAVKSIKGVSLFNNSSAVGLSTIGSVQQCQFIANDISPLELESK